MCIWIPFILLKTENNTKIIKKLLFELWLLFICLIALFMSHEQCNRRWVKKKKKTESANVGDVDMQTKWTLKGVN